MREIKFRAWDKKREIMSDSFTFGDIKSSCGDGGEYAAELIMLDLTVYDLCNPNLCEIMQYTGLNDLHNRELYVGDIIRIVNFNTDWKRGEPSIDWRVFEIIHNRYTYSFNNSVITMPLSDYSTYDGTMYSIVHLGNKFQNKNLMDKIYVF